MYTGLRLSGQRSVGRAHGRLDPAVIFKPLTDAGFGMPDAVWALLAVTRFAFGWAMDEQAAVGRAASPAKFDPNAGFEFGLSTIIAGLKARAAQAAPASEPTLIG